MGDKDEFFQRRNSEAIRRMLKSVDYISSSPYVDSLSDSFESSMGDGKKRPVALGRCGTTVDCVVVCALPEEREMLFCALGVQEADAKAYFDYRERYGFSNNRFEIGGITFAVVVMTQMGMVPATSLTTRAILAFNPKLVCMSGICAGRKSKVSLGSVVVASCVFDYSAGKYKNDGSFSPRPRQIAVSQEIGDYIVSATDLSAVWNSAFTSWRKWKHEVFDQKEARVEYSLMGCGTSVVDNIGKIEEASQTQDELSAIDMESYGVAYAANALSKPWIIAKGVQDFADGKKNETEGDYRDFAGYMSGKVVFELASGYLRNR